MMLRRHLCKILCIGLTLIIVYNLVLVFYTKMTLQKLILGGVQKELHLPLSEWNRTVIKRLSHLELELQHLSKFLTVTWRGWCLCVGVCVCTYARAHLRTLRRKGWGE